MNYEIKSDKTANLPPYINVEKCFWEWYLPADTAFISNHWKNIFGFETNLIKDYFENWSCKIHPKDYDMVLDYHFWYLREKPPYYSCEYRIKQKNGEYIWILSKGQAKWDKKGRIIKMTGFHMDISETKNMQRKLRYLSQHDPSTGIPLAPLFIKRLEKNIVRGNSRFAVLYIRPNIPETAGIYTEKHPREVLLKKIVAEINRYLTPKDLLCRISQNEYALLFESISTKQYAEKRVREILNHFCHPLIIDNSSYTVTLNIGMALYPLNGLNAKALLRNSSIAMCTSEKIGTNKYCCCNSVFAKKYIVSL